MRLKMTQHLLQGGKHSTLLGYVANRSGIVTKSDTILTNYVQLLIAGRLTYYNLYCTCCININLAIVFCVIK